MLKQTVSLVQHKVREGSLGLSHWLAHLSKLSKKQKVRVLVCGRMLSRVMLVRTRRAGAHVSSVVHLPALPQVTGRD